MSLIKTSIFITNFLYYIFYELNTGIKCIGDIKSLAASTIAVPSGDTINPTNICSLWLLPGSYIVDATAKFVLPKQTQIEIHVNSSDERDALGSIAQTLPSGIQWIKNVGIIAITGTESKNVILKIRQNSGNTLNCNGSLWVMQIK